MKSLLSLLAVAALGAVVSVRAQDESPSPAGSPDDSSSSSMQAPSSLRDNSTSSPTPQATPSPETKATEAPAPAKAEAPASPALPSKKASTSGATEKKERASTEESETAATTGPDKGNAQSNVKRLETQWEASVMKHDTSFVEARVAKDFVGVSSKGKRMDKRSLLKEYKGDSDVYTSAKNSGLTVRAFGPDVAVATGTAREVGKTKAGAPFNRSYVWTDTWMRRGDQWQCVASQVMVAPGK